MILSNKQSSISGNASPGTLNTCLKKIYTFNAFEHQKRVYEGLLERDTSLKFHHSLAKILGRFSLSPLSWLLLGLRTALMFCLKAPAQSRIIAIDLYKNHRTCIDYVNHLSAGLLDPSYLPKASSNTAKLQQALYITARSRPWLFKLPRIIKILNKIEQRYGWSAAHNCAVFIVCYARFLPFMSHTYSAVVTASDFDPTCIAFAAAAKQAGLKHVYVMHGQISSKYSVLLFPRLDADYCFLFGLASLETYERISNVTGVIFLCGFPGEAKPLKIPETALHTVGISLANYYDDNTTATINTLAASNPGITFLLRCHPGMKAQPGNVFAANVRLAPKEGIEKFAERVQIVYCGSSTSILDLIKAGCPPVYLNGLDALGYDDLGLVRYGAMPEASASGITLDTVRDFYSKDWIKQFRQFDALYLANEDERAQIAKTIRQKLAPIL